MKKKVIIGLILCLLIGNQLVGGRIIAKSKFETEWKEAVKVKQQILAKEDNLKPEEKYELAVAYANLGEIEKGNKLFEELGEKDWEEKIKELIREYLSKIKDNSSSIKTINYLGFAYYIDSQYEKAEEVFKKIVKLDPKNIWSHNYLAVIKHELKKYEQAEDVLEESLEIEENEYTYFLLGVNYYKKGNLFKAAYYVGKGRKAASLFLDD